MLFLADLLKFKTAFGKLWLAGTIGVKKRPFNKNIIINSDIEEFVNALFNVEFPLSPRLSGTFLCGVCAIYEQKCYFLHLDVLALFRRLYYDKALKDDQNAISASNTAASHSKKRKRHKAIPLIKPIGFLSDDLNEDYGLDTILNEFELNDRNVDLHEKQKQQQSTDDALELLVRSQLQLEPNEIVDESTPCQNSLKRQKMHNYILNEDTLFTELAAAVKSPITRVVQDTLSTSVKHGQETFKDALNENELLLSPEKTAEKSLIEFSQSTSPQHLNNFNNSNSKLTHENKINYLKKQKKFHWKLIIDYETTFSDNTLAGWRNNSSILLKNPNKLNNQNTSIQDHLLSDGLIVDDKKHPSDTILHKLNPINEEIEIHKYHHSLINQEKIEKNDLPQRFETIEKLRGIFDTQIEKEGDQDWTNLGTVINTPWRRRSTVDSFIQHHSELTHSIDNRSSIHQSPLSDRFRLQSPIQSSQRQSGSNGTTGGILYHKRRLSSDDEKYDNLLTHNLNKDKNDYLSHNYGNSCSIPIQHDLLFSGVGSIDETLSYSGQLLIESGTLSDHPLWNPKNPYQIQLNEAAYTMNTWKFRMLIENELKNCSLTNKKLYFGDVVPFSINKLIAARAFYHLLVLCSSGDIETYQDQSNYLINITRASSLTESSTETLISNSTPQHNCEENCSEKSLTSNELIFNQISVINGHTETPLNLTVQQRPISVSTYKNYNMTCRKRVRKLRESTLTDIQTIMRSNQ